MKNFISLSNNFSKINFTENIIIVTLNNNILKLQICDHKFSFQNEEQKCNTNEFSHYLRLRFFLKFYMKQLLDLKLIHTTFFHWTFPITKRAKYCDKRASQSILNLLKSCTSDLYFKQFYSLKLWNWIYVSSRCISFNNNEKSNRNIAV